MTTNNVTNKLTSDNYSTCNDDYDASKQDDVMKMSDNGITLDDKKCVVLYKVLR
eukprot:CAMPEP_0172495906 /NCGR_PEP_ID=MMETSP1066-20121228/79716_1 /TAXON_ID=671091 /ORGANISM="Coscinodiscus wailesii, Strain CCMP2513" /LENGTH=53 /DNA_ID=CAMNT_0013267913 /DNA_START=173 /DNA_END=330 /DNA_ORIENTATION=+